MIKADALAITLQPAQEAIQPEAKRDSKGARKGTGLGRGSALVAKETGCGIMKETAQMLKKADSRQ